MDEYMPIKKYIEENYVPKAKIRAKIKELEDMRDGVDDAEYSISRFINQINILQELLGGEE